MLRTVRQDGLRSLLNSGGPETGDDWRHPASQQSTDSYRGHPNQNQRMDAPMSRTERPSRPESASGLESAHTGTGFDSHPEEEIRFGCSMLSQIRLRSQDPRILAPMRCSLGYALHSEDDVAKCRAVEGPGECWKAAPSWRVAAPGPGPRVREREQHSNGVATTAGKVTVEVTEVVVELIEVRVTTGTGSADGD